MVARHGTSVRSVRVHRVVGVADRNDAGAERNGDAGERIGIALAAEVLVRGAHEPGCGGQRGRAVEDALSDDGVAAHERPFLVVERAGLFEDGVRHGGLPDVVQRRGLPA